MNPPFIVQIDLSEEARSFIEHLAAFPGAATVAIKRGIDDVMPQVVSRIQSQRLTGQGPFPVAEHMLGVVSGQLRQSVWFTPAVIEGDTVTASLGSPLRYAAVHEFGFEGTVQVRPFFRKNRTRDQFSKVDRVSARTGRRYRATVKTASGVSEVKGHTRRMRIPARSPFGYGVADSEPLIVNAITSQLEAAWKAL